MRAIENYKDHPSIRVIKQHVDGITFKFCHVNPAEVMKQIDLFNWPDLTDCINSVIHDCNFPNEMKIAELIPVYKNNDSKSKYNDRAIRILLAVSTVYERA